MEMLIVVAIIAVLAAIAIPTFTASLHKARVAADWANLRAYYAELQAELLETGEYRDDIPTHITAYYPYDTITFLNGQTVKLQAGKYNIIRPDPETPAAQDNGYQIHYCCTTYYPGGNVEHFYSCSLTLGASG